MKMPEWLEKERDENRDPSLHFRTECAGFRCGARKSYDEGFAACFELMSADIEMLRESLKKVTSHGLRHYEDCKNREYDDQNCNCGMEKTELILREALEKSDRWKE